MTTTRYAYTHTCTHHMTITHTTHTLHDDYAYQMHTNFCHHTSARTLMTMHTNFRLHMSVKVDDYARTLLPKYDMFVNISRIETSWLRLCICIVFQDSPTDAYKKRRDSRGSGDFLEYIDRYMHTSNTERSKSYR